MSNVNRFTPAQRMEFKTWLRSLDVAPYVAPPETKGERAPTPAQQRIIDVVKAREAARAADTKVTAADTKVTSTGVDQPTTHPPVLTRVTPSKKRYVRRKFRRGEE